MNNTIHMPNRAKQITVLSMAAVACVLLAACAKKKVQPPPPSPPPAVVVMPLFPGGMGALTTYLDENTQYPDGAHGVGGTVSVRFLVGKDGVVSNVKAVEGISPDFDAAAVKAVSDMPKWNPGTQGGEPVGVNYQLAVRFVPPPPPPAVVVMPRFPGGTSALSAYLDEHAEYPEKAKVEGIEGTVAIRCLIGKDGWISNVEVVEGMSPDFNASAVKAVSGMPKWMPGTQGGIPISVEGQLRVEFVVPPAPSLDALVLMPYFPGGLGALAAYLDENLEYPFEARKARIEGTVHVGFVIGKDGSISDVEVVEGVSAELDAAAVKAVKGMPDWLPGTEGGIAVSSKY